MREHILDVYPRLRIIRVNGPEPQHLPLMARHGLDDIVVDRDGLRRLGGDGKDEIATDPRRRALPEHGLQASVVMHRDMVERPDCHRRLFGDLVGVDMTMCVNDLSHETFPLY